MAFASPEKNRPQKWNDHEASALRHVKATWIGTVVVHVNRGRPIVVAFHGVTSEKPGHICNHDGKHLYLPLFEQFMKYLAVRYSPVSLGRIVSWLAGDEELPHRSVAVTFDDGYRNVLTNAGPVLSRLGIPATVFVVTDFVGKGAMIWTDQIISALMSTGESHLTLRWEDRAMELPISNDEERKAADRRIRSLCKSLSDDKRSELLGVVFDQLGVDESMMKTAWSDHAPLAPADLKTLREIGVEVGSHTCSHRILAHCGVGRIKQELVESKQWIEAATGAACEQFSYPNGRPGDFNDHTRRQVMDAGYRCAATTVTRRVSPNQNKFEIPRFTLANNDTTLVEFGAEMSGFPTFLRTVKRGFRPAS